MSTMTVQHLNTASLSTNKTAFDKACDVVKKEFKAGGLLGDTASGLKLMNFWTELIHGAVTESSKKMTDAGSLVKNYICALELPQKVSTALESIEGLQAGTLESIANCASGVFGAGKAFSESLDLVGGRFGLLNREVVEFFKPLNPAGTLSFGFNEAVFKHLPAVCKNWEVNPTLANSALLKLVKNVAYAVVGALSLVAIFFGFKTAAFVIPSLLTGALAFSVASRFFDGIVLSGSAHSV